MARLRAPILACAVVLLSAVLGGCLGSRLKPEAPSGVRLQGVWKLNRAASEDPQKIIDALRAEANKKIRRAMNTPPPISADGGGGGGPRRRGQRGGGGGGGVDPTEQEEPPQGPPPGADVLRNAPTMHALLEVLQRSDYMTIRASADSVSFDYGTMVRSYTPGGHSVVSSENGVADQNSGWDGKEYVVNIRPQLGPAFVEEYTPSADGKQLIVKTRIGPFELQKVNLTRVYDATGTAVPHSGPSNE